MNHDELQEQQEWEKIAARFFKTPRVPDSESFVHQVMSRLDRLESARVAAPLPWFLRFKWMVPAMAGSFAAAAFAGFLLVMSAPVSDQRISTEALLLINKTENIPSEWFASSEVPKEDQILGTIVEGL
jgi:hypothetical protein